MKGKVKWYNRVKGYGFLVPEDGSPEVFVHHSAIQAKGKDKVLVDGQEETAVLGAPCLTMRENTERPITCEQGTSRLVGRSSAEIARALKDLDAGTYPKGGAIEKWDGQAGARIAEILL